MVIMTEEPRCKSCKIYLAECKELAAKIANHPNKELELRLTLGTMHCRKKHAWVQPLCWCTEWEGE